MPTYSADYLLRLIAANDAFGTAFDRWMGTQREVDHTEARGLVATAVQRDDADPAEVQRLELEVAEAAGTAGRVVAVTGAYIQFAEGLLDPIANWSQLSRPRALISPRDVRTTVANVRGRLQALLAEAEAGSGRGAPAFAPSELHPVVWAAAAALWTTHQYRVAIGQAANALNQHWKEKLGRGDANDTNFWEQTLSAGEPQPGKPKLVWPGDPEHLTTKAMRGGLEPLATSILKNRAVGLNLTVRNVSTHGTDEWPEQEAMEQLSAYSHLARLLDRCEIRRVEEPVKQPERGGSNVTELAAPDA